MSDATTGAASRRIDLDAARAARAAKRGPAPVVVFGGVEYVLPHELDADVVTEVGMLSRGDVGALDAVLDGIFGAGNLARIKAAAKEAGDPLTYDDLLFLIESAVEHYGLNLPGSSASGSSS